MRKQIKSIGFALCLMAFAVLFLVGSPRLIGHAGEEGPQPVPIRLARVVPAMLNQASGVQAEHGCPAHGEHQQQRLIAVKPESAQIVHHLVLSDANGNVLGGRSYMHEVYQSFALGDGFV